MQELTRELAGVFVQSIRNGRPDLAARCVRVFLRILAKAAAAHTERVFARMMIRSGVFRGERVCRPRSSRRSSPAPVPSRPTSGSAASGADAETCASSRPAAPGRTASAAGENAATAANAARRWRGFSDE